VEETWVVVFRNLYTGFLLRDFAGKIVPGVLFIFSVSSMFRQPRQLLSDLKEEMPTFAVLLVAGLAWTITLGTQSLAEGLGIWRYFPVSEAAGPSQPVHLFKDLMIPEPDKSFDAFTLQVDEFQSKASNDEEQQYERFVVIKEACGNLFVAAILAIPAWIFTLTLSDRRLSYSELWLRRLRTHGRAALTCTYIVFVLIGLHRMHAQHVDRQIKFAQDIAQRHKDLPVVRPQASSASVVPGKGSQKDASAEH
jgi:hypothetical protein